MAHGRPWLPRGGATALRGWATELMGDVVIILLSERQTHRRGQRKDSRRKENEETEQEGEKERKVIWF